MRLFGASLRLTPPGLARKPAPGGFLFGASLRLTPPGLARKSAPDGFLFGASLRLTPPGLARKSAPDGFLSVPPPSWSGAEPRQANELLRVLCG